MKKYIFPIFIVILCIQLLVPVYMIGGKYDILRNGEEVKLRVRPIDPYDAFRGRYVALGYAYDLDYTERRGKYGILAVGQDGFAEVVKVSEEKPSKGLYLISKEEPYFEIPQDRYYMEEALAPKAERLLGGEAECYITVRIKNGKSVISGLYINGEPAERYLSE